ncbi:hypothetical protein BFF78_22865 [Streptomyces fodineus]|uniref:Uncharacterized protein n=1 Tax=Streptomyces fodineus TaxID=1904616 RepID=A0A1D7YD31_9ACTN|nr:hypothetical protein [Streptomyces fodineus]AOR33525.1 hypothetical protein BFF78_22865 [Streptomyces fodineus]
MTTKSEPLEPGSLLFDPATSKVGEYQAKAGPYAMLRPVGGGREWQADPASLRPATLRERLSAEVGATNRHTRAAGACVPPDPEDLSRPPRPVPGCRACLALAEQRDSAQASYDRSAETDANVLLRQHQRREHRA